jgi:lysyl-tRNA synthetase class 2
VQLDAERRANLERRADAKARVHAFFRARGFVEVDTPLLVRAPALDVHIDSVAADGGWLITSPEYQMKRLLAAGMERVYQVCRCFRANERGAHHATEFTMVEWYRANEGLDAIRADVEALVHDICGTPATRPPWPRKTVRDAMAEWAGVRVDGDEPAAELAARVRAAGIDCAADAAWDDAFFTAFVARVDPAIAARDLPLVLDDWPAPLAALARRSPADPRVALRFEAYAGGLELANAFDELVDPVEQRARFEADRRARAARGKPVHPIDEKLLAALGELPPCAGVALGFDRLVMLASGAPTIDRVLAIASDEL